MVRLQPTQGYIKLPSAPRMATPFLSLVSTLIETLLESSHPLLNRNPYAVIIVLVLRSPCRLAFLSSLVGVVTQFTLHLANQPIVQLSHVFWRVQPKFLAERANVLLIVSHDFASPPQRTKGLHVKSIRVISERIEG